MITGIVLISASLIFRCGAEPERRSRPGPLCNLTQEEQDRINVTYGHKPEMTLIGFFTTIRLKEGYSKCPEFWDRAYNQKYARLWKTMTPETPVERAILENRIGMFAICDEKNDSFDYWIAGPYNGGEVPDGLALYTFPESDWAMFSAKGPLPGSLQKLNTAIWQEWYPNEGQRYIGSGRAMLEVYSAGDMQSPDYKCGIWIPVRRQRPKDGSAQTAAAAALLGLL